MSSHPYSPRGYGFIFLGRDYVGGIDWDEEVDFFRLFVEWFLLIVLTGGLLFLSKEKNPK
jgi:hypothetical protein